MLVSGIFSFWIMFSNAIYGGIQPFSKWPSLDSSKLKVFTDDSFKFNENGRKFSKKVETMLEKEKLLITSNFSFLPQCFPKTCSAET